MGKKMRHIILFFLVLIFVVPSSQSQSPSPSQSPSQQSVSVSSSVSSSVSVSNSMSSYILNKDIATKALQTYLSSNVVTAIAQDKNGMMWFGTRSGLNSYDSYGFEEYNQSDGIINATITDICAVGDTLFVGTEKGLCIYDIKSKKTTNYFYETDSLLIPDDHVFHITKPINGKVIFCTKGGTSTYDLKPRGEA